MKDQKDILVIDNVEIVRSTDKAYLICFPKGSKMEKYGVWFPKSKVSIKEKRATITLVGDEYQVILAKTTTLSKDELANEFGVKLSHEE